MTLTRWTSWHLHLTTGATSAIDRILTEVAVPVAEKRPWFFIRYWQGGPHLRLRVADLTPGEATEFTANLKELMLVHAPPHEGEPTIHHDAYTAEAEGHARGETKENRHISDLRPAGVYFAHYEPETERYGGEHVMAASEDLFIRSSALVVELLPSLPSLASRKLAALRLAQSAAQAIGPPKAQAVF